MHRTMRVLELLFWPQIAIAMPSADAWCVAGDFNMIETPKDMQSGNHDNHSSWDKVGTMGEAMLRVENS